MLKLFGLLNLGFDEAPVTGFVTETITGQSFIVCRTVTSAELVQRVGCSAFHTGQIVYYRQEERLWIVRVLVRSTGILYELSNGVIVDESQISTVRDMPSEDELTGKIDDLESLPLIPEPVEEAYVCPTEPEPNYDELRARLLRRLALLEDL